MNYLYETSTEKNHKNFPCCMTNGKKRLIFSTSIFPIEKKYQKLHKDKKPPQKTRIKPHETAFILVIKYLPSKPHYLFSFAYKKVISSSYLASIIYKKSSPIMGRILILL